MKENIRFRGLSFDKDEQSAAHGELSLCAGVELHDGALRPSVLEGTKVQHEGTDSELTGTLLYVHETPSYRHYITQNDKTLYWYKKDGTDGTVIKTFAQADGDVISVNSVGNTLLVMTEKTGLHYILWKETNYKYLGTQIPFLPIEFRPTKQYTAKFDRSTIDTEASSESTTAWRQFYPGEGKEPHNSLSIDQNSKTITIDKDIRSAVTEAVQAIINQANNTVAKDGHFYAPFMLRYCYRLYDGSMVMHSAPVFMNVSLPQSIKVYCDNAGTMKEKLTPTGRIPVPPESQYIDTRSNAIEIREGDDTYHTKADNFVLRYSPSNVGIEYLIVPDNWNSPTINHDLNTLKNDWSDIVSSVDIFVSAPILREDFSNLIEKLVQDNDRMKGVRATNLIYLWNEWYIIAPYEGEDTTILQAKFLNNMAFDIPTLSEDAYLQKILDTSSYFKIASYKLEDLKVGWGSQRYEFNLLDYDKSIVPNITVQEEMKDDYHTHNQLLPISPESGMYVYNHRLNLYGMKEKLYKGIPVGSMMNSHIAQNPEYIGDIFVQEVYIELQTESGKKLVGGLTGAYATDYILSKTLYFYPDSRATKMYIQVAGMETNEYWVLKMEPLNFLNGAVASEAFWKDNLNDFAKTVTLPDTNDIVPLPNRIITSEVDNPYMFPLNGRNAVGIGNVKGIAAVTRALSQGQVGDHDLVVFSTDGIWVLKVSSEGTYMAAHNISREVCSNPRSICQLDQSIVFATQRSLSKFVESDVVSISDVLDGPIPNLVTMLPGLAEWFSTDTPVGSHPDANIWQMLNWGTPAVDMFNGGRVFYDYASSRIVVLQQNTSKASVALVFSIRDMAWSTMMVPAIRSVIPGYPSPFVQIGGNGDDAGKVMILDRQYGYSGAIPHAGLIITRTLTFSDTMDIIRGFRQLTDSAQMPLLFFYGSNDQRKWQMIGQTAREFYEYMPGHPFRFFRIAINTSMLPSEEYQQLELEIISKYAKL